MADPIVDPFQITPKLKSEHETALARAQKTDDLLTGFIQTADQIQETRKKDLEKVVESKKAINDKVQEETSQLKEAVTPIFQQRVAVANQAAAVVEMNPIVREIKGIFNKNFRPQYLAEKDQALAGQLSAYGEQYKALMGIHDAAIKGIESDFSGADSLRQLELANGEQDVQLASQHFGTAQQVFGTELAGLQANQEVLQAQTRARLDLISGASPGDINKYLSQAKKNGGEVVVNGVPLRVGELQEAQMGWQEKQMALESRQLAIQSQKMGLAEQYEQKLISHMTGPELQAAIQSGGKYKGQVLNEELLTRAYTSQTQRQALLANQSSVEANIPVAQAMIRQLGAATQGGGRRASNLFGMVPREMETQAMAITTRLNGFAAAARKAHEQGVGAEFVQSQIPVFQKMLEEQQALQDRMADKWAGGDKNLKAVASAWMAGRPLSSPEATKGLIQMARSGIPAGTKLSGPALAVYNRTRAIVQQYDAGKPGDSMASMFDAGKKKDPLPPELVTQVSQAIIKQYTTESMNDVLQATPALAKGITAEDGTPHPFNRVRPEDFQTAVAVGDAQGYKIIGQKMGLNPEEAEALFKKGAGSKLFSDYKEKHKDANFSDLAKQLQTVQTASMLQALDHTPSAANGFKPSSAYVDLLRNPQFQQTAMNAVQGQSQASAGDFIVGQVAGSQFDSVFHNYTKGVSQSYAAMQGQATAQAVESAAKIRNMRPWDAANMTLSTIDGITEPEKKALMAAVAQTLKASGGLPDSRAATADQIDSVITKTKFQDPGLEKVRQTAARDWSTRRPMIYKGLSGFLAAASDLEPTNIFDPSSRLAKFNDTSAPK